MSEQKIYILGAGTIGMSLAVYLARVGKAVTAVRTSTANVELQKVEVEIVGSSESNVCKASIEIVSLAKLQNLEGIIVITAKAYANQQLATQLQASKTRAPIVILQNGVGVENPYLNLPNNLYRCVIYATSQKIAGNSYKFVPVNPSPIGIVRGTEPELNFLVGELHTPDFPFVAHRDIKQEVWKKAAINSVFNSICPILEVDNGIFIRDEAVAALAREVVEECLLVMRQQGVVLTAEAVMQQIFAISKRSEGQLISTLQDLNEGRETEIDSLNLEIARLGKAATPEIKLDVTRVLGEIVKIKSGLKRK